MEYNSQLIFQSKFGNIKIISKEERISNIDFTTENIKNSNSKILNITKNQIEEYLLIPCHRVVASNGKLTGFSALGGTDTKKKLLDHEKVII